ncbi:MAG: HD domain-containing protein [Methylotenera sp.]|uniref:HD domain-containing phosphohydrolase n=1 Tax=Methylotenera sp. TaxID=2051956 RepID=UPI0027318493|nr:HD domain-containing phosphohydrolase [Methylotenera sp.]MDP1523929.1 HD domain-containing protein [Methylotenera sp.]
MSNQTFEQIDFARYQRWINRAAGSEITLMVFDNHGKPVWGENTTQVLDLGLAIAAAGNVDAGMHRNELDGSKTALYQSLGFTSKGLIGWVAVIVDYFKENDAPINIDHLVETIDDLTASIADEYRHKSDLDMMTEELGARYEELHLVYAVDQHVQAHTGENMQVFQSLLQSATEHLNVDVVAFVRPTKNICQYATSLSKEIHNLDLVLVEMRGDLYRFAQASGETIVLNAADDPRRAYIFTDMPYKVVACPVHTEGKVDALVVLLNHQNKTDFSNSDRKLGEVLANQLSSLSNTFQLLESMREFNEQLAMSLIEAVEAKDPYTRGHSERVHHLSMEIGKAMNLPADELEDLHWGSLLHDVGKIGIPDAVLCKPSRLTKDEYTFIMVHPERSYEILRHIKHLDKAVLGARHHQEMYDGKGYPHGLKGERIPLHARIIAVADTYDSITSSRAYRAGRSHEVAMQEIERVVGTQLDPAIVEVFRQVVAPEPEWLQRFSIRREKAAA